MGSGERKDLLAFFPIGHDEDGGFIAALKELLDPVERIRNPVAHSREIPKRARKSYGSTRERIWKRIAELWLRQTPPT